MKDAIIFQNFAKHITLNDYEISQMREVLVGRNLKKKDIILSQGKQCKKLFFVETGSLRAYNVNGDAKESTIMFALQDWWITDMSAFVGQKPSLLSIEALEDSAIVELDFRSLQNLFVVIPKLERFFRILFQNAYIREQSRVLQSISFSTEERYLQFLAAYPQIVEKVTQKQIATYLGVTPEFLSTIKKSNRY